MLLDYFAPVSTSLIKTMPEFMNMSRLPLQFDFSLYRKCCRHRLGKQINRFDKILDDIDFNNRLDNDDRLQILID